MTKKVLLHDEGVPEDVVREDDLRPGAIVEDREGNLWWKERRGWSIISRYGTRMEHILPFKEFLTSDYAPYTLFRDGAE